MNRSPKIVTVLGLGFEGPENLKVKEGGRGRKGRVEALPVFADGGCFPNVLGKDSVARIFELPEDEQPLFFMLSKDDQSVPASDLQDTNRRLGNLLPNCTRRAGRQATVEAAPERALGEKRIEASVCWWLQWWR